LGLLHGYENILDGIALLREAKGIGIFSSLMPKIDPDIHSVLPHICKTKTFHLYFGINKSIDNHLREPAEFLQQEMKTILRSNHHYR
jgi:hypothetical protein